jgi:hypothetical protein
MRTTTDTTSAHPTAHAATHRLRRGVVALATALATALAMPAFAQPDDLAPQPDPEPRVEVEAHPTCDPEPGFVYQVELLHGPIVPVTYRLQWRPAGAPGHTQVQDPGGLVATGNGEFEVRGVVHELNTPTSYYSDWQPVIVDCPGPDDGPTGDPVEIPEPDDDVVTATPTFTG